MSLNGIAWTPIGPDPILREAETPQNLSDNGMVTTIAVNPNNPNSSTSARRAVECGGHVTAA